MIVPPDCPSIRPPPAGVGREGTGPAAAPSPLRVLVIDDEASLRECVAEVIQSAGHQVEEAGSSAEGIQRLQTVPLDVVLTDLRMPGGSGWEVVRAAHALHPGLSVLVMTGDETALAAADGAAPLAGILVKPFAMEELLGRLATLQEADAARVCLPPAGVGTAAVIERKQ